MSFENEYSNQGRMRMKKESMYFIAGAGLMAVIMFFNMTKDSSADCVAVASAVKETNPKGLSAHEYQIYSALNSPNNSLREMGSIYLKSYKYCMALEGKG